jgi:hypothetical protein
MKDSKVAHAPEALGVGNKVGKRGADWGKGSDLTEGVSAREGIDVKDAYAPVEAKNRMPKGHDRI